MPAEFAQVPRRHPALRINGDTLELPRRLAWLPPRRFRLDGLTRMLWQRIDGRRTLGDLVEELVADEQLGFHEARLLTVQLLRVLIRRGAVVLGE